MSNVDLIAGPASLGDQTNKVTDASASENLKEGIVGKPQDTLSVDTPDEELIALKNEWTKQWESYADGMLKKGKSSTEYWLGKHFHKAEYQGEQRPIQDNLIFEALETFLPEATKQNPEPTVDGAIRHELIDENALKQVKDHLVYQADIQHLRLLLKRGTRNWALKYLGAWKVGWDPIKNDIQTYVVRPDKIILDKDSSIDVGGKSTSPYVGEVKETTVKKLFELFPNIDEETKQFIQNDVDAKDGSKIQYTEWWYEDFCFYTYKDKVLDKLKNPNWNWPMEVESTDMFGMPTMVEEAKPNHFAAPESPYTFMTVFGTGIEPFDETSLIEQNLPLQDLINTTLRQIVKNNRRMNNSIAISGDGASRDQAQQMVDELENGGGIFIPSGNPEAVVKMLEAKGLPADVYNMLGDYRNELRGIFGVTGLTAQGISEEKTVRGKIIVGNKDNSRIGGGISEVLEQCADRIFNLWYQMMLVHYDETHFSMGELSAHSFEQPILISVKEGSLIPQDDLTKANQAVDLAQAQLLDPLTLYEALDFPDPKQTLQRLVAWQTNPMSLLTDVPTPMAAPMVDPSMMPPAQEPGAPIGDPSAPAMPTEPPPTGALGALPPL